MAPPFPTYQKLIWATLRVDLIATSASTAAGFVWIFGFAAIWAVVMVVFDLNIWNEDTNDDAPVLSSLFVAGVFGGGFFLMFLSSRMVYCHSGLICPSCESRLDSAGKNRRCRADGCCPSCGKPMALTSHNPSPDRSGRTS